MYQQNPPGHEPNILANNIAESELQRVCDADTLCRTDYGITGIEEIASETRMVNGEFTEIKRELG